MDDKDKYESVVRENNDNGSNRLVNLSNQMSDPDYAFAPIAKYKGGPGSKYGIGETIINKADRVNSFSAFGTTEEKRSTLLRSFIPMSMQKILQIDNDGNIQTETPERLDDRTGGLAFDTFNFRKQDYRIYKNSIKQPGQRALPVTDYETQDADKVFGFARSRTDFEYQADYTVPVPGAADKINALGLYYSDSPNEGTAYISGDNFESVDSSKISRFRIKAIDNDHPGSGVYMVFRAFLTNIDRRIDARWNEYSYVGRGESFFPTTGLEM